MRAPAGRKTALLFRAGVLILLGVSAFACRAARRPQHLVLVTIDTLRADRVGCYGGSVATPHLDGLAREGAMAEKAMVHVPLTRPSHVSLFTGRLPTEHGIRDNVSPAALGDVPVLAGVLREAGFRTAAFVSSIVLASGFGIERGFETYQDQFPEADNEAGFMNTIQKPGTETLGEASAWLEAHREARLFAWIHLYEPHDPYEPPEPYRSRYPESPYDGEVAFSDELIGRLDQTLTRLGMREDTLLVVTSDHGEGLGDHRESLHGFFIYETTLSVPLFFRGPGVSPGLKLPALVRTVDLLPTLLDLMGVARPQGAPLSGESLAAALDGGDPPREPIAYAESLVPLLHFGWSDLRSVRRGNWKYIQAPRPELYDLATDPGEKVNRVETESGRVRGMQAALGRYLDDEKAAGGSRGSAGSVPPELLAKLGALGYVGAGAPIDSGTPGADPKDKIDEFRVANDLIREGIVRFHDRDFEGSVSRYQELLRRGIESFEVHFYLARGLMGLKRFQEAETHFAEATARLPAHVGAWEGLAGSRSARGDLAGALAAVKGGQRALPQEAGLHQREGALLIRMGRAREARRVYETAVALAPRDALLRARLGELLRDLGEVEEAIRRLSEAVELDPEPASYWNSMGMTLGGNGRLPEAEAAFREAWKRNDKSARYAFNLGLVLLRQGRGKEARPFFEAALHLEPGFAEAKSRLQEAGAR